MVGLAIVLIPICMIIDRLRSYLIDWRNMNNKKHIKSFKSKRWPTESETLAFAEWIDINCVRNGEHKWVYRGDNFNKSYDTQQLYTIYHNEHES